LMGQKDLPLAPTPKIGFEMVLLRMLAFSPVGNETQQSDFKQSKTQSVLKPQTTSPRLNTQTTEPAVKNRAEPNKSPEQAKKAPKLVIPEKKTLENIESRRAPLTEAVNVSTLAEKPELDTPAKVAVTSEKPWHELVPTLSLDPMALQLANNAALLRLDDHECELLLVGGHVSLNKKSELKLEQALSKHYGRKLKLILTEGAKDIVTPNSIANEKVADRQRQAEQEVENSPIVKQIIALFDAKIAEGSIKPID